MFFLQQSGNMTEDFDIEAMLEAPYKKEVRNKNFF